MRETADMSRDLPTPGPTQDVAGLFLTYLDFYRDTVADKVWGLSEDELRTSRLPSGWTPIELVNHLAFMERRWVVWGFCGEQVDEPWGDHREGLRDGRWYVSSAESLDGLLATLHATGERTREIVEGADLGAPAADTGRFAGADEVPSLTAILFHVLQEYARHAGHLDVARELADGTVGE